jgi:hypothetical protein
MKTRLFVLMLTLFLISNLSLAFPEKTYACSCAEINPKEAFERSEAVFAGKVLNTKQERQQEGFAGAIRYRDANLLEVDQVWKGLDQSQTIIYDDGHEASCGIEFEAGKSYLVYVYTGDDGDFYTGLCSRTAEISSAGADLRLLGQGKEVDREVSLDSEMKKISKQDYDMEIFIGGMVVVLMVTLVIFMIARRKQR